MKVGDPNSAGISNTGRTADVIQVQGGRSGRGGKSADADDNVQLSLLGSYLRGLGADSPDQAAHVQQISNLVKSGAYQINSSSVSAGIIQHHLG